MSNDLTFFTNDNDDKLHERFRSFLSDVRFFDVLVGYFRSSGFHLLADALEHTEHIRILVGLDLDRTSYRAIQQAGSGQLVPRQSTTRETEDSFAHAVVDEMETVDETLRIETGIRRFMAYLESGRLEVRAHPSQNIHAKVYISRFSETDRDYGRVITGSSNFSYNGLVGQHEFNVELKDAADVHYALDKFESLWADAVDVSQLYQATVQQRTWLNDRITPYQIYLKFLYEYFREELDDDHEFEIDMPDGFIELEYQKQAVSAARRILDKYNGVFIADVVGLGKTYIAAMLAQQLPGRKLVICPPVLKEYWEDTFREFGVPVRVESMGRLDKIIRDGYERYDVVFVDEAHRFRNEETKSYEQLYEICFGRKVVLVSATPLNNYLDDVYALLKLFQAPRASTIPGIRNLDNFFRELNSDLNSQSGRESSQDAFRRAADRVRQSIFRYVMVRRTRGEIERYFQADLQQNDVAFPLVEPPQRIIYQFDETTGGAFDETITRLRKFHYSRYTPLLYLRQDVDQFTRQSQRNVGQFMKVLLVKRLESSFHAFKQTLQRFIGSYENFIGMFDSGQILISKDVNVYSLLEQDDPDVLAEAIEAGDVAGYDIDQFREDYRDLLQADLDNLNDVLQLWQHVDDDPKLDAFVAQLQDDPVLRDNRLIVFTESSETAEYLYKRLEQQYPNRCLQFSSAGGRYQGEGIGVGRARDIIRHNYDPRASQPLDDVRILITTDVLAEGINLHRSNVVINYDLPWNPTRVLQRVGRVNRVGSTHDRVYIYNFFPTDRSSQEITLEANIKNKINAFHEMLGEDSQYLSDEESPQQHQLFGGWLFDRIEAVGEQTEPDDLSQSELEYLSVIRSVRDEQPDLYEQVKRLPLKARAVEPLDPVVAQRLRLDGDHVLTFFRRGWLKKFYRASEKGSAEVDFFEAAMLLQCTPDASASHSRARRLEAFYRMLMLNRAQFEDSHAGDNDSQRSKQSTESKVMLFVEQVRRDSRRDKLGEAEQNFIDALRRAYQLGTMPRGFSSRIWNRLDDEPRVLADPRAAIAMLRQLVPPRLLEPRTDQNTGGRRQIILSAYLVSDEGVDE